jgi:hypothetical protein
MAQVRSLAKKYASISRPKGASGQSSYFSTLAKRTQAAEDDVVDHDYSIGNLSAEYYKSELTKRLSRTTNTPLQMENLKQKIVKVQEDYNDSIVQNQYKTGQITDRDMYNWENSKLAKMSAADGTAYQTQATKVAGLLDKANKADRKQYRITEMNRISRMPEDTSQLMASKVAMYQKLRDMAIEDGDQNDATTLDTTYQNSVSAANRLQVTEGIEAKNRSIKEQYHPTEAGVLDNTVPAVTTGTAGIPSSGFSGAATSGAVPAGASGSLPAGTVDPKAALQEARTKDEQRLANAEQRLQSLKDREQEIRDTIEEAKFYKENYASGIPALKKYGEVDMAADYAEKVKMYDRQIIESNDTLKTVQSQLAESTQYYEEVKKDVAYKTSFVEKQDMENQILDAEQNLNLSLQTGQVTKEEYLDMRREIIQQKVNLYSDLAQLYSEYDKTNPAADVARKAQKEELTNLRQAVSDVNNVGRYELVDAGDGTIKLTDVYKLKSVSRNFEQDYLQDGNVWRKVMIPDATDTQGNPLGLSGAIKEGYSAQTGTAFVVKMIDGKMTEVPVTVYNNKPILAESVDPNQMVFDAKKNTWTDAPKSVFQKAADMSKIVSDTISTPNGQFAPVTKAVKAVDLKSLYGGVQDTFKKQNLDINKAPFQQTGQIGNVLQNLWGGAKNVIKDILGKAVTFPVIEHVSGQEEGPTVPALAVTPEEFKKTIHDASLAYGVPEDILTNLLAAESSWDKNVISGIRKSSAGALGIAQFMPDTARALGIDPLNPNQAIQGAAKYLKQKYDKFKDWEKALAAYNAGDSNVIKYNGIPPFEETQNYVRKIMGNATTTNADQYLEPGKITTTVSDVKKPPSVANGGLTVQAVKPTMSNPNNTPGITPVAAPKPSQTGYTNTSGQQISLPKITPVVQNMNLNQPGIKINQVSTPKPAPAPTILQKISSAAGSAVNTAKNVLSKLKFW